MHTPRDQHQHVYSKPPERARVYVCARKTGALPDESVGKSENSRKSSNPRRGIARWVSGVARPDLRARAITCGNSSITIGRANVIGPDHRGAVVSTAGDSARDLGIESTAWPAPAARPWCDSSWLFCCNRLERACEINGRRDTPRRRPLFARNTARSPAQRCGEKTGAARHGRSITPPTNGCDLRPWLLTALHDGRQKVGLSSLLTVQDRHHHHRRRRGNISC